MGEREGREEGGMVLNQVPFWVYTLQRVEIFHQWLKEEKESLGISRTTQSGPTTYITVRRDQMLEDGYRQLGLLSSNSLKGTIRVKFVNAQVNK